MSCRVVCTWDQREAYAALVASMGDGRAVALLDPGWPTAARRAAEEQLRSSAELRDGDLVVFTSGSTSRPRAVVRSMESWRASLDPLTGLTGLTPADTVWLPGPLWSSLYLYGAFHAAHVGAGVLVAGEDAAAATVVHCVPATLQRLLGTAASSELGAVRLAVVAGDRLQPRVGDAARRRGWRVLEYYGAAELSFIGWRDDDGPLHPFPGVETRITDGVLWSRSRYQARGYLHGPQGGRGDPLRREEDGWATVGDLADVAGDGFLVRGRGDAAVATGGHTVLVEDVEEALRVVAGLVEVAVAGVPHPLLGEQLVAVYVGDVEVSTLKAAARSLPTAARPARWLRAEVLPRSASGKLARGELRSWALAQVEQSSRATA